MQFRTFDRTGWQVSEIAFGAWQTEETYTQWAPGSIPSVMFQGQRFTDTLQRVSDLKDLCAPYYPTLAEAAMRSVLSESAVSTVIPGMTSRAMVDMNVAYSDGDTFPADLKAALPAPCWVRNYHWETKAA